MLFNKTDFKYTLRLLAKKPGFALLSMIVLAGGLGLSIFCFTVLYTTLYKPLQLTNGDSIHQVCAGYKRESCLPFRAFEFAQFRDEITTLESLGVYSHQSVNIEYADNLIIADALRTEWTIFQLSDTQALLGRTLQEYDQDANAEPVVVLGYGLWQTRFEGDPAVLGSSINIQDVPTEIVGVMPDGYRFTDVIELWLPINQTRLNPSENGLETVFAYSLLKKDETSASASLELAKLMGRSRLLYPTNDSESVLDQTESAFVTTYPAGAIGGGKVILTGAGIFLSFSIFLLACINVGTLLLARTNERLKDISIRVALGAPRKRLLIQTMGESVVISILGGILAVLFASAGMELMNLFFYSVDESALPFWMQFHADGSTIFGVVLFVALSILFTSAIPCWRIINGDFNSAMRDGTRGAVGLKPGRLSRSLVVASITIITLLLFMGSLYSGEMINMKKSISATNTDNLINLDITFASGTPTQDDKIQFLRSLVTRLKNDATIGEVEMYTRFKTGIVEREGLSIGPGAEAYSASIIYVLSANDRVITERKLLEGRYLNDFDNEVNSQKVAVISRTLADNLWPNESAIDQRLRIKSTVVGTENSWLRIVGIFTDNINASSPLARVEKAEVRMSLSQTESNIFRGRVGVNNNLSAASEQNIDYALSLISRSIFSLDKDIRYSANSLSSAQNRIERVLSFGINVVVGCALFSFLIAIAGIYGLVKNTIQMATQEIGTRRAIGATDKRIILTFLYRGGKQVITGFVLAVLIAAPFIYLIIMTVGFEFIQAMLLRIFMVITGLYACVVFAIYYPIKKVLQLEPSEALRYE